MRKTIIESLLKGMLSNHSMSSAPAYFMDAFQNATEWEWDHACDLADRAKVLIRKGYNDLETWWVPQVALEASKAQVPNPRVEDIGPQSAMLQRSQAQGYLHY